MWMQVVGHRVRGPFSLYPHIVTPSEGSRFGPDVVDSGFQSLEAMGEMTPEISSLRRNLCFAVSSHSFFSCGAHGHFLWESPGIVIFTLLPKVETWARRGSVTVITQTRNPLPLLLCQDLEKLMWQEAVTTGPGSTSCKRLNVSGIV